MHDGPLDGRAQHRNGLCVWPLQAQTFTDVTEAVGMMAVHGGGDFGIGIAWGDYDADGRIDLYVTDEFGPNTLLRNHPNGSFEPAAMPEVALASSVSMGAVFADYDNDGDQDLFVANDGADALLRNDGGAGFTDVAPQLGIEGLVDDQSQAAAWADFDGDGDLDLFVINYQMPDFLYRNDGETFANVSDLLSPTVNRPGLATTWLDFDLDGDPDLLAVNDRLFGNWLYRNDGPGCGGWCFTDVSEASGAHRPVYGMGVAVADYDSDGDGDLVIGNWSQGYRLYRNDSLPSADPISFTVRLAGDGWINRDAIGARILVTTADGRQRLADVRAGSSFGSNNERAVRFGVDPAQVTRVEIRWPDGSWSRLDGPRVAFLDVRFSGIFRDGFEGGDAGGWPIAP